MALGMVTSPASRPLALVVIVVAETGCTASAKPAPMAPAITWRRDGSSVAELMGGNVTPGKPESLR